MVDLKTWNECVAAAKNKYGITGYVIIKGRVLKEAQKAFSALNRISKK
jgi:hypothetical protein